MAYPHPTARRRPRALAVAGVAGLLALSAGPVGALSGLADPVDDVCTAVEGTLAAPGSPTGSVLGPACSTVDGGTGAIGATAGQVLDGPLGEALAPVADVLPGQILPAEVMPPAGDGDAGAAPSGEGAPPPAGSPPQGAGSSPAAGTTESSTSDEPAKVEAAGKAPVEVMEPVAPAADGRVAEGPTLQPTDLGALGGNIAGIRSQSGLTLQPFDMPLVSTPTDLVAPQVAGLPITTASPAVALAADALSFAGATVLPQTDGQAALVTIAGLGMVLASGVVVRRRAQTLSIATLDTGER